MGCFDTMSDGSTRTVKVVYSSSSTPSNSSLEYCAYTAFTQSNWMIFAVEGGTACYAGNSLHVGSASGGGGNARVAESNCNIACAANSTELCGGTANQFTNVYSRDSTQCFYNGTTGTGAACTQIYYTTTTGAASTSTVFPASSVASVGSSASSVSSSASSVASSLSSVSSSASSVASSAASGSSSASVVSSSAASVASSASSVSSSISSSSSAASVSSRKICTL